MLSSKTAWENIRLWAKQGTGGGRHVQIEVMGHRTDGVVRCVITFKEWAIDVMHPRPKTVTTSVFDPTNDEAFCHEVTQAIVCWAMGRYDQRVKDE